MAGTMTNTLPMRRTPKQARSQQRVEQILNAAEQLFVQVGFDHTTTNAIAAHAGVSIGSLYQFFPDKDAVLAALIERYREEMRALIHDEQLESLSLEEAAGSVVERLAAYDQDHAGFKMLLSSAGGMEALHTDLVEQVSALMARRMPSLSDAERPLKAAVSVGIVKGLMALASPPMSLPLETVVAETKRALAAYLKSLESER